MIPATPPSAADIAAARNRIAGQIVTTPLLRSPELDEATGGRVFLKAECLQRTGSFKFRGALNALLQIPTERRGSGVVAFSSGNHALGVALAARILGLAVKIVMPYDAPALKREWVKALGAEIIDFDRVRDDREAIAREVAASGGSTIVPPYEHVHVIAGQGTIGLEIVEQAADLGARLDAVIAPHGGGGLMAGLAIAISSASPRTLVHTAEPAEFNDMERSLNASMIVRNDKLSGSVCDALLTPQPGDLTFSINRRLVHSGCGVTDAEALAAVAFAFRELKLVVEPSGAVGLAAILSGKLSARDRTFSVILSGGNVGADVFARAITADARDWSGR